MKENLTTFRWFDSSFDFFFGSLLSVLSPPLIPLFSLLPLSSLSLCSPLSSHNLVLSVSLLKPKCCSEGHEPLKSGWGLTATVWPPPLAGQEQREGRALRPQGFGLGSFHFLLDTPRRGRWSPRRQPETRPLQGPPGALSGQWCSSRPSHPWHDGAWHLVDPSSPECKHLR
uniref:Uncharacterized protein n=1 Tax=Rhinopithecus roxellana TaxID=61622 RepID=A0A2K6REC4_RHIRO